LREIIKYLFSHENKRPFWPLRNKSLQHESLYFSGKLAQLVPGSQERDGAVAQYHWYLLTSSMIS